jgi:cell division protein FtsB
MTGVRIYLVVGLFSAVLLYFCYHALAGEQGLARWAELQAQEITLRKELTTLETERDRLLVNLTRLRDSTLDLDYVEELARTKLSYSRADELIIAVR